MLRQSAVAAEDGEEVEVLLAGADLEADAARGIAVEDQDTVAEDAVDEVGRGAIEDDELDRQAKGALQAVLEIERIERRGRLAGEEHAEVDVAPAPARAARRAAEKVDRRRAVGVGGEQLAKSGLDRRGVHGRIIATARRPYPQNPSPAPSAGAWLASQAWNSSSVSTVRKPFMR